MKKLKNPDAISGITSKFSLLWKVGFDYPVDSNNYDGK